MPNMPVITLNVLLGMVCAGFAFFVWSSGARWGPEGPVGAAVIPIPFLMLLLGVLVTCARRGVLDWMPGGAFGAGVLVIGLMVGVGVALYLSFEQDRSWWQWGLAAATFVMVGLCACLVNGVAPMVARGGLAVAALGGWGYVVWAVWLRGL